MKNEITLFRKKQSTLRMKTTGYNSIKSWGIAVACGFVNCLLHITKRLSSILFVAFVVRYDTDRQNAAFFIIISIVFKCVTGPLTGLLGEIVDKSHLTVAGCFIAALGTGCCYFAEDILSVTIFLGIINGFGMAIGQPLLPQILKQHFSKNIAIANGITNSVSSGLAIAIIPVIVALINLYEVSGALLITSGIMLHAVPIAMLLKDPKYNNLRFTLPVATSCKNALSGNSSELKNKILNSVNSGKHSKPYEQVTENTELNKSIVNENNLKGNLYKQKSDCVYDAVNEVIDIKKPLNEIQEGTFNTPTLQSISIEKNLTSKVHVAATNDNHASSCEKQNRYGQALKTLLVFKDPTFLVIMLYLSLFNYVGQFFYTIVIEISRDKGYLQSQEHIILMLFPTAEIIGHTCLGWITDKRYLSVSNYNSICCLGLGMSCFTFVLSNNYFLIMIATMFFGLCFAAIYSTSPSLVYEFIEEEQQSMAVASRLVFYTPMIFTMPPLIDYYRGTLCSYDGALYLLTGICIGCALLLLLLPSIAKCSKRKK